MITHPGWCDPGLCTVTPDGYAGSHRSRSIVIRVREPNPLHVEVSLEQGTYVRSYPLSDVTMIVITVVDTSLDDGEACLVVLYVDQARVLAYLLRALIMKSGDR